MILKRLTSNKLWLAPLAGYTDQAFRRICKEHGADILVSEMVSADGLIRDSKRTIQYVEFLEEERPFGVQIFGSDPLVMAKAAEFLIPYKPDFIDINMGCPVKKVVRRNSGSALMKDPELAASIVRETKTALAGEIPLGVKFRSGWDNDSLNYLEFGLLLQASGADFLCLHARTTKQMFSGLSNWEHIAKLKQALEIPLIGNGDIKDPESALKMMKDTGCDSVMIGRGALGKPWIFDQIKQYQTSGEYSPLLHHTWIDTILQHLDYALQTQREAVVVKEMRSQLCFYTKGMIGGAELRHKINQTQSIAELKALISSSVNTH
jgi:nifR3 family TIM-barrel protein